jgi:hypothetical protein
MNVFPEREEEMTKQPTTGKAPGAALKPVPGSWDAFAVPMHHGDRLKGKICRW